MTTWPSALRLSWTSVGNSASTVAPITQNQLSPSTHSHTGRCARAAPSRRAVSATDSSRCAARVRPMARARSAPALTTPATAITIPARRRPPGRRAAGTAHPRNGAGQDAEERTRLDQAVARNQLVLGELTRQVAIFERLKNGRLHPEPEQDGEQQRGAAPEKPQGGQSHQHDLGQLRPEDHALFF